MRKRPDPFADAPRMIRRIYGYVAFRMGRGPDAEDVTSEVFERALRHLALDNPASSLRRKLLFKIQRAFPRSGAGAELFAALSGCQPNTAPRMAVYPTSVK